MSCSRTAEQQQGMSHIAVSIHRYMIVTLHFAWPPAHRPPELLIVLSWTCQMNRGLCAQDTTVAASASDTLCDYFCSRCQIEQELLAFLTDNRAGADQGQITGELIKPCLSLHGFKTGDRYSFPCLDSITARLFVRLKVCGQCGQHNVTQLIGTRL